MSLPIRPSDVIVVGNSSDDPFAIDVAYAFFAKNQEMAAEDIATLFAEDSP